MVTQLAAPTSSAGGADESYVLPNGLKVILAPQLGNPVVSARVVIKAGSADELSPKEYGLAHLMEHMAFKGTAKRKVGEISSLVETNGGSINAYTSFDETCYHLSLPAEKTGLALDILADLVFAPTYDPEEYRREKEVVVEEINRALDSPDRVLAEEFMARSFKNHPYGHMILGSPESVRAATRNTALAFHKARYRPDNAFLVVSGGFAPKEAIKLVDEFFGPLKNPKTARPQLPAIKSRPNNGPEYAVLFSEKAMVPKIILGFKSLDGADERASQLDLVAAILSLGRASRLWSEIKTEKGLVTDIDASAMDMRLGGTFYIGFETEPAKIEPAMAAVLKVLEGLATNPPTEEELARARALTSKSFLLGQESAEGQNGLIASFELQKGDYRLKDAFLARWSRLLPADLISVARDVFRPENLIVTIMLPEGSEPPNPEKMDRIFKGFNLADGAASLAPEAKYESHRLANGLEVLLLKDSSLPRVTAKALVKGGLLAEKDGEDGLANIFAEVWPKASQNLGVQEMAKAVENLGANLDGYSARNSLGLSGSFLAATWERGLGLLTDLIVAPALNPESLTEVREEVLTAIKAQDESLGERAARLLRQGLYPNHPYHRDTLGLSATVSAFTVDDLKGFYQGVIRPETLLVVVAGDIDPPTVLAFLTEKLGSWSQPGPGRAVTDPAPPQALTTTGFALDEVDRAQNHLILGFLGAGLGESDQAPLEVLNAYLSGMGGVLFRVLRDQQSLAYVVTSVYNPGVKIGTFFFYIGTEPSKSAQAVSGMLDIIQGVIKEPIPLAELEGAKSYLLGVKKIGSQTLSRRVEEATLNKILGLGLDYDAKWEKAIKEVTVADVQRVAAKYLDLNKAFFAAAGVKAPVDEALAVIKAKEGHPAK
ncbi:MAG: insulinase family protein [Deltaproteobacteria bacterium]|nr:insulinase family protein [Deltaproteobacteria bacterium]